MKLSHLFKRIFITKKCLICKEPISYDNKEPFCQDCIEQWRAFLETKCHKCGFKNTECTCLPSQIKSLSKHGAVWCVFYSGSSDSLANNLVFRLKREYNRDMIEHCAKEMAKSIKLLCHRHGISYKDYQITFAPRRKSGKRKFGFDHTRAIAKALGKILGIEVENCFINVGKREQKSLTKLERRENAKASYFIKNNICVEGKRYFVVDDIITSGATMRACVDLLTENGATDIIPVAYAKNNE
jgi:predicted amidophosphoribosyltransferase